MTKTDPTDTTALLRFAELAVKAGHAGIACETYARAGEAFAREGAVPLALSAYASALTAARDGDLVDGVVSTARTIAKLYVNENLVRDAVSTLDTNAGWLIERGLDADALRLLEERLSLDDSGLARVRFAETFFRLRAPAKAIEQLGIAFRRLQSQGRNDEALDVAERLIGERPDVALARTCAEMYLDRNRAGDPFLALAKLRICCDEDPTDVPTLDLLARAFELAGHADKAVRVRREIALTRAQRPRRGENARRLVPDETRLEGSVSSSRPAPQSVRPPPASVRPAAVAASASPAARPSMAPPRLSAIRPKALPVEAPDEPVEPVEEAKATEDSIQCFWDDLVVEPEPPPHRHIDPSHPSFWPVDTTPAGEDDGKVVSVSLADVELIDTPPTSAEQAPSLLETALECIESLCAQERYEEAALLVVRNLTIRPRNRLLLERRAEIETFLEAQAAAEDHPRGSFGPERHVRAIKAS